jgi:uracil-DNA glycosylase
VSGAPSTDGYRRTAVEPSSVSPTSLGALTAPLAVLAEEVAACRACPRLVAWREEAARVKRAAFRDQTYWARPVPGFGDPQARICLVGLAPAAHGANRTGRMFTGDRSGEFLYAALWRVGLANQPESHHRDDGLRLHATWITAPVRCAPPDNKPTPAERDRCRPFLARELELLTGVRVIVALGQFAHQVVCGLHGARPRPPFAHGAVHELPGGLHLVDSFHVSQQNTFTGRLTADMFDRVLQQARDLAGLGGVVAHDTTPPPGADREPGAVGDP